MVEICSTCLSHDRKLVPLNTLKDTYIFYEWFNTVDLDEQYLCWECHAIMTKFVNFRRQVIDAHFIMSLAKNDKSTQLTPFSKLTFNKKSEYFETVEHTEKSVNHDKNITSPNNDCDDSDDSTDESDPTNAEKEIYTALSSDIKIEYDPLAVDVEMSMQYFEECDEDHDFNIQNVLEAGKDSLEPMEKDCESESSNNNDAYNKLVVINDNLNTTTNKQKETVQTAILELNTEGLFTVLNLNESEMKKEWNKERKIFESYPRKFGCKKCLEGFNSAKTYKMHVFRKHSSNVGPYVCPVCQVRFDNLDNMIQHCKLHYRSYKCTFCNYQNRKISNMYKHSKNYHRNTIKVCEWK